MPDAEGHVRYLRIHQHNRQRGVFVVLTAIVLLVLIGIVGLAVDVSRQLVIGAELQNSADACALAGVAELNGAADAPKRAAQAGIFVGGMKNKDGFQRNQVTYANVDITFSDTRNGTYLPATSASISSTFMKCDAKLAGLVNVFMGVLGFKSNDLQATAIATLQPAQLVCMSPMSIHAKDPNDKTLFGYQPYDVINNHLPTVDGSSGAADPVISGVFEFANPLADANASASQVSTWIQGSGVCNVPTVAGTCINEISTNGITSAWNSRFGAYAGSLGPAAALPDLTGVAYDYTSARGNNSAISAYKNTDEPNKNPFKPTGGDGWNGGGYSWSQANHLQYGTSNRRLVGLPVVDASAAKKCNGGSGYPVVGWACALLLAPFDNSTNKQKYRVQRIQILGRADQVPYCGTTGIPGGSNANGPLVPALVQ